jgi:hypothetical protein
MRHDPNLRALKFKEPDLHTGQVYQDVDGVYRVPCAGVQLTVIASNGLGWDHVSVSLRHRTPTWAEMEFVRALFFRDDETVMQLSVPRTDHISCHPFCLHLWRPQHGEIPRPPNELVGAPGSLFLER